MKDLKVLRIKLILVAISSFSLTTLAAAPSTHAQLKGRLERQLSKKNVVDLVSGLITASQPSRMIGKPGHQKARDWIVQSIAKFDPKNKGKIVQEKFPPDIAAAKEFYQKDFDEQLGSKVPASNPEYQKWLRFTEHMKLMAESLKSIDGVNISWEKQGINSKKWLVVTAHYDTISHNPQTLLIADKDPMPGANYNASGVAVALGLVKAMAETDFNYSVQVIFLDWQGVGFLGSLQAARTLKNSGREIMGVINLEMLGQDSSFFDKTKKTGNMSVYLRDEANEIAWVKKLDVHGQAMTKKISYEQKPKGFDNSDNIRFWEQGFLSATYTQNWDEDFNPKFYQTPQDTPETLNQDTLYNAYLYLGGAVMGTLLDITK